MPYCTQDDLIKELSEVTLIELTDDTGAGVVTVATVTDAIKDADSEIDIYCSRYQVPFNPVPDIIGKLSQDIAIYNLHSRRPGMPENRKKRYDDAIKFLTNISKGIISLDVSVIESVSHDGVKVSSEDRVFTRDTLKGY